MVVDPARHRAETSDEEIGSARHDPLLDLLARFCAMSLHGPGPIGPTAHGGGRELVVTLALILAFSPEEKEQALAVSGFAHTCPANPVARMSVRR
jgi:hypothetical protein